MPDPEKERRDRVRAAIQDYLAKKKRPTVTSDGPKRAISQDFDGSKNNPNNT